MKWFLSILIGFAALNADAQLSVVNTIAGNGIGLVSGNGGPALQASLDKPAGIVMDKHGNIYFSDFGEYDVRKISPSGIITLFAGNGSSIFGGDGGPATSASIYYAHGLSIDTSGNIYICDAGHYRVRKVDVNGIITTIAGNNSPYYSSDGGLADTSAMDPIGVTVDAIGNVYVADYGNNRVRKIDAATGIISTVAGTGALGSTGDGGAAINATLNFPMDVKLDAQGNLYIVEYGGAVVRKVNTAGIISTVAGTGTWGYNGDSILATQAKMLHPSALAFDHHGILYITDQENNRIRKIDTSGLLINVAGTGERSFGGDGGPAMLAKFNYPIGIVFDDSDNLYICDQDNWRIRKITFTDTTHVDTTNSVSVIKTGDISIYPNPVKDAFTLTTTGANITNIDLYDEQGRKVYGRNFTKAKSAIINTKQLPAGTYLLWVNGRYMQKVVKE